jgi:hypothetical protein
MIIYLGYQIILLNNDWISSSQNFSLKSLSFRGFFRLFYDVIITSGNIVSNCEIIDK